MHRLGVARAFGEDACRFIVEQHGPDPAEEAPVRQSRAEPKPPSELSIDSPDGLESFQFFRMVLRLRG